MRDGDIQALLGHHDIESTMSYLAKAESKKATDGDSR
jgi:hypothetical protein